MKKTQISAGFIQVILIILVAVAIGGAYYFGKFSNKSNVVIKAPSPTPVSTETSVKEETANWKVFSDNKYGFQIKLPSYFNIPNSGLWSEYMNVDYSTIDLRMDAKLEESSFLDTNGERYSKSILIESYKYNSLEDWRKNGKFSSTHKFISENNNGNVLRFSSLVLGQTGYIDNDMVTGFATINKDRIILIAIRHFKVNQKEADIFISQILSTFKFTK